MKRTIISLLAFALGSFTLTHAQGIRVGDRFYDGSVVYTVQEVRMGTVVYMTDAIGDEELTLEQWGAKPDLFRLQPSRNAEEPKYGAEFGCRVNYVSHQDNKYLEVIGDNDIVLKVLPIVYPMEDITEGSLWYGGSLVYDAHPAEDGSVRMNAMAEGEEHEFVLTPATGGVDLFEVSASPSGAVNVFESAAYARRIRQDGLDVICFYDKKNRLMDALQATQTWDSQALNVGQWMAMIAGDYVTEGGKQVHIGAEGATHGGKALSMQPVTFNGMVTGVFDSASHILLNGGLRRYDKPLLRVMRNAILAAHGQVFRSRDLKAYFEAQPWYTPAAGGASAELSLLEQLNVALILAAERAE